MADMYYHTKERTDANFAKLIELLDDSEGWEIGNYHNDTCDCAIFTVGDSEERIGFPNCDVPEDDEDVSTFWYGSYDGEDLEFTTVEEVAAHINALRQSQSEAQPVQVKGQALGSPH